MDPPMYEEERALVAAGLRSRVVAPLMLGATGIGIIALSRRETDAFVQREVELVTLLGRLVATAVQNIRAYHGERERADELRRLSGLRADFVSLVSHELRSPMAAVIGSARTLQSRWSVLSPEHREAFLSLIVDETTRLAALIGDVLDTSRIDAGTFSISFGSVDLRSLAHDCAGAAAIAQQDVAVVAHDHGEIPAVRADPERVRQILVNLIDNAVKYSPRGETVEVETRARNGSVVVAVSDHGPGIAVADQQLVFEKFGRVAHGDSKPGTGLGLYIARSIAEAHGGSLSLRSTPGSGATFELVLPIEG
jgi:signal transduction histidine kinase